MHRCSPDTTLGVLILAGVLCLLHQAAPAQFLELDPLPPAPELGDESIVVAVADELRSEIDVLRDHPVDDPIISSIASALRTQRKVAFLLLAQARAHPEAHHTAIIGLSLAQDRDAIDRMLVLLGGDPAETVRGTELDVRQLAELLALLDHFSANATNIIESVDPTDRDELDAALAFALQPLLEVLLTLEERIYVDPWPSPASTNAPPLDRCRARIAQLKNEPRKASAQAVFEQVESLVPFPDLRSRAEMDAATIERALELEKAIADARWLSNPRREAALDRLDAALQQWQDPATRVQARAALKHLAAIARLVEATNELDRVDPQSRAMRRSIDETVAEEAELDTPTRIEARIRRLARATAAIQTAATIRMIESKPPPRHLLSARRSLDKDYKRAEKEVFDRLTELVGTSDALVDPDLAGLVARQQELADDLIMLRDTQVWSDFVQEKYPTKSRRFNTLVQTLSQQLTQSARRARASRMLDEMSMQFEAILDPPFLERIQAGDPEAIALSGGRDRELLERHESTRDLLIDDMLDSSSDNTNRRTFALIIRLLEQLETLSLLIQSGGADNLPRWGGWLLHERTGRVDPSALSARLKIAIELLLRGEIQDLEDQLDRLEEEAPLAQLAMHIGSDLGESLRSLPDGSSARMARLSTTPSQEDLLVAYRDDLTRLARYTWELEEVRRGGDAELANAIQEYCAALARLILEDLQTQAESNRDSTTDARGIGILSP